MESTAAGISALAEEAKELQETAASLISRTTREEDALRQRVAAIDARINSVCSPLRGSKDFDKVEEELKRVRYILSEGDAAAFLPSKSHGMFLRMFLGPINVRANRKDVQLKVKEEYNNFRDRTAFLFLCLPSLLLILRSYIWGGCLPALPVQLYQAWLLYLYTGLALRENILRVNGSNIRPWWIKHHYFAMAMALISLTWEIDQGPDCAQNQARRMDVVWGETAGVEGQLLLLCPILFVLQGFEAYVGFLLLNTTMNGSKLDWQVITCGVLLIVMAVGNFVNTVQTLVTKSRVKAKIKRGKSRQELHQLNHGSDDKSS
ncbi:transmembrane protein 120 homolog isoform X2 [Salvia splendens]|uniref:transmembrane protein 120 homolog isoform X2 n=1 Tax=Salvia splendens TaxID=180675 RepID=UPI001C26E2DC|nr:transmembrane protein 120 homolog isoform X2 [Salvia splendens]